jgi:hypothetical protein
MLSLWKLRRIPLRSERNLLLAIMMATMRKKMKVHSSRVIRKNTLTIMSIVNSPLRIRMRKANTKWIIVQLEKLKM